MRREIISGALLTGVLLTGCSGPSPETLTETERIEQEAEDIERGILPNPGELSESIFTPDGRRITILPNITSSYMHETIAVTEYCSGGVGGDLITVSEQRVNKGAAGGVDRAVGHAACADGVLTPEDFSTGK